MANITAMVQYKDSLSGVVAVSFSIIIPKALRDLDMSVKL